MTEPTTEAGRRLLAGMPWTNDREKDSWARLVLAIEQEARADLDVERLARALHRMDCGDTKAHGPDSHHTTAKLIAAAYREDAG